MSIDLGAAKALFFRRYNGVLGQITGEDGDDFVISWRDGSQGRIPRHSVRGNSRCVKAWHGPGTFDFIYREDPAAHVDRPQHPAPSLTERARETLATFRAIRNGHDLSGELSAADVQARVSRCSAQPSAEKAGTPKAQTSGTREAFQQRVHQHVALLLGKKPEQARTNAKPETEAASDGTAFAHVVTEQVKLLLGAR